MVFQHFGLFPWKTVFENVAYGLRMAGASKTEIERKVPEFIKLVGLGGFENAFPYQMSGGMQQRCGLARALAVEPNVLLMDEPLGSLDKRLRQRLQDELRRLQRDIGITTVYVTHDQDEAFALSHRVAVMRGGVIEQVASPDTVYNQPASRFVAGFVGDVNILSGSAEGPGALGVRPERVVVSASANGDDAIPGRVESLVFQGRSFRVQVRLGTGELVLADIESRHPELDKLGEGEDVFVHWSPRDAVALA